MRIFDGKAPIDKSSFSLDLMDGPLNGAYERLMKLLSEILYVLANVLRICLLTCIFTSVSHGIREN